MNVEIRNCRNIAEGNISIVEGKLNIRYGVNGIGKTTISIAIQSINGNELIDKLIPYSNQNITPEIIVTPNPPSLVMVFNEEYIDRFLFKETNVIEENRVYEVLIKNELIEEKKERLRGLFQSMINLINSYEITSFMSKMDNLKSGIQLTTSGEIKRSSKAYKALKDGNRYIREHIPDLLYNYTDLLTGNNNIKWIDWFNKGHDFSGNCPYCRAPLPINFDDIKETISDSYKKNDVKNASVFLNSLNNNFDYLNDQSRNIVIDKFSNQNALEPNDEELTNMLQNLYKLEEVLKKIKGFTEFQLLNETIVIQLLENYNNIVNDINFIGDEGLSRKLNEIQDSANEILEARTEYLRQKGEFNTALRRRVEESKGIINKFMHTAGIPYEVEITEADSENPKTILKHVSQNNVNNILDGLSFGERNAFALMMFLMDVKSKNPDLVILDDPISSFDENKKFAILHALFLNGDNNLKNRTVLMLTHDFTPIIDLVKIKRYSFVDSRYLKYENGVVSEYLISKEDVKSVLEVAKNIFLDTTKTTISRIINYRRYLELSNNVSDLKYEMISSILKLREFPMKINGVQFSEIEKSETENIIRNEFPDFEYDNLLSSFNSTERIISAYDSATSYEKTNIVRVLKECVNEGFGDRTLQKFIYESYHIENTYTFQLDPNAFDSIPTYIIAACDEYVERHR